MADLQSALLIFALQQANSAEPGAPKPPLGLPPRGGRPPAGEPPPPLPPAGAPRGGPAPRRAVVAGAVRCWGANEFGALGDGTTTERLVPTPVSGVTGVAKAAGRCTLAAGPRERAAGG
ncbi:MAG: hypothetical protein IPO66_18755 [Rhodanobacteraceae bacterium]|nr:hypothetical protein [Rhodanobacteraceae bacterium]